MCNCNQKRQSIASEIPSKTGKIKMRFTGKGNFAINGDITGRLYSFTEEGATALVDPRDAIHFEGVPELQRIS